MTDTWRDLEAQASEPDEAGSENNGQGGAVGHPCFREISMDRSERKV
jgi:hypothetical protein